MAKPAKTTVFRSSATQGELTEADQTELTNSTKGREEGEVGERRKKKIEERKQNKIYYHETVKYQRKPLRNKNMK